MAKAKLEKEHGNVTKLSEHLKIAEAKVKELSASSGKLSELESSLFEYQKKAKSYKAELNSVT